jgi:hypothetical protein
MKETGCNAHTVEASVRDGTPSHAAVARYRRGAAEG